MTSSVPPPGESSASQLAVFYPGWQPTPVNTAGRVAASIFGDGTIGRPSKRKLYPDYEVDTVNSGQYEINESLPRLLEELRAALTIADLSYNNSLKPLNDRLHDLINIINEIKNTLSMIKNQRTLRLALEELSPLMNNFKTACINYAIQFHEDPKNQNKGSLKIIADLKENNTVTFLSELKKILDMNDKKENTFYFSLVYIFNRIGQKEITPLAKAKIDTANT